MKPKRRQQGLGAIDLIEEATHLVRTAPAATLAAYYLGAIPFVLGLLFFWADMSRNPFASEHLADASLAMGLLFLWMKFCQAIFARRIRAQRAAQPAPALTFRAVVRIFLVQIIWQPSGLFLIPLSAIPLLTFPWVYGFYQNVTALSDGQDTAVQVLKKSSRQAGLSSGQNAIALLILIGFIWYVYWNWAVVCFALPQMFKMLFGIESKFTESPLSLLNTTFFAAMFGLTYLCVDPILKTYFALRCFYGESLQSGEDLKADLSLAAPKPGEGGSSNGNGGRDGALRRPAPRAAAQQALSDVVPRTVPPAIRAVTSVAAPLAKRDVPTTATLVLLLSTLALTTPAFAAQTAPATAPTPNNPAPSGISSSQLDGAINQTIHENKYIWRMPREKIEDDADEGPIGRFFDKIAEMFRKWARAVAHWLGRIIKALIDWLNNLLGRHNRSYENTSSGYGWIEGVELLVWLLIVVVVSALVIFLYRVWRGRAKFRSPVATQAILPVPDVSDENVGADQLPEDEWMKLGRELLGRGELRLAMRAFYLASLAHLAARNLISIARFKSNREYERELLRRGHSFPELLSMFGQNISVFEAIWYGMHEVSPDSVNQFAVNVERIKSAG